VNAIASSGPCGRGRGSAAAREIWRERNLSERLAFILYVMEVAIRRGGCVRIEEGDENV